MAYDRKDRFEKMKNYMDTEFRRVLNLISEQGENRCQHKLFCTLLRADGIQKHLYPLPTLIAFLKRTLP